MPKKVPRQCSYVITPVVFCDSPWMSKSLILEHKESFSFLFFFYLRIFFRFKVLYKVLCLHLYHFLFLTFENLLSPPDPCFDSFSFIICISLLFIQAVTWNHLNFQSACWSCYIWYFFCIFFYLKKYKKDTNKGKKGTKFSLFQTSLMLIFCDDNIVLINKEYFLYCFIITVWGINNGLI